MKFEYFYTEKYLFQNALINIKFYGSFKKKKYAIKETKLMILVRT